MDRRLRHRLRMVWIAVRYGKPWIHHDCWGGVLAKGPGGVPETDPLLYFRIPGRLSGLPVDLLVQDGDGYLDTDAPRMVLFHNGYGTPDFGKLVPMSLSTCPRVMVRHFDKGLTEGDYQAVRSFVRAHRAMLRSLSAGPPSPERAGRFLRDLRRDLR